MDSDHCILEKHSLKLALDALYSTSIAGQMLFKLGVLKCLKEVTLLVVFPPCNTSVLKGLQKRLILFLPRRPPGLTCGVLANESIQIQP